MTIRNDIIIEDTTLRDGEQAPGVAWSVDQKLAILQALISTGLTSIEVGIPKMGGDELAFLQSALEFKDQALLIAWNRGIREDIDQSIDLGFQAVHIGLPTSDIHLKTSVRGDRTWVLKRASELVKHAKDRGTFVSISAEDVGRTETTFLQEYAGCVKEAGADRLRLSDTIGVLSPEGYSERVENVVKSTDIDVQCHCHNDYGLAVANTIAGLMAGAKYFHVCVNGIGERAGMPDLAQVSMALKHLYGIDLGLKTSNFNELSKLVSKFSNATPEPWKPIVGENVFAHESGIHSNGMLKNNKSFEPFEPSDVGGTRRIVIGKHSGRAAIVHKLKLAGIDVNPDFLPQTLDEVRRMSVQRNRAITSEELVMIYKAFDQSPHPDSNGTLHAG